MKPNRMQVGLGPLLILAIVAVLLCVAAVVGVWALCQWSPRLFVLLALVGIGVCLWLVTADDDPPRRKLDVRV